MIDYDLTDNAYLLYRVMSILTEWRTMTELERLKFLLRGMEEQRRTYLIFMEENARTAKRAGVPEPTDGKVMAVIKKAEAISTDDDAWKRWYAIHNVHNERPDDMAVIQIAKTMVDVATKENE